MKLPKRFVLCKNSLNEYNSIHEARLHPRNLLELSTLLIVRFKIRSGQSFIIIFPKKNLYKYIYETVCYKKNSEIAC